MTVGTFHVLGDERLVRGVDDDELWLRVADDLGGLVGTEARIDRHEDGPELGQGREDRHRFERGLTPPCDAVLVADPESDERVRGLVRPLIETRERQLVVAERRRESAWRDPRRVPHDVPDQQLHGGRAYGFDAFVLVASGRTAHQGWGQVLARAAAQAPGAPRSGSLDRAIRRRQARRRR